MLLSPAFGSPMKSKILSVGVMTRSHTDGSDTNREPKTGRMKDQLVILENIVEQMMEAMYQHGEKVEWMDTDMGNMVYGISESM
jgi:hypothetical protein